MKGMGEKAETYRGKNVTRSNEGYAEDVFFDLCFTYAFPG